MFLRNVGEPPDYTSLHFRKFYKCNISLNDFPKACEDSPFLIPNVKLDTVHCVHYGHCVVLSCLRSLQEPVFVPLLDVRVGLDLHVRSDEPPQKCERKINPKQQIKANEQ